ncbi:MAG: hypothetical protein JWP01_164 [Myxococcales bacterium]|nr:hypothetical protein [Myxococcales bacterium]
MRIGEILLLRDALDPWVLSHTLLEQPASGMRLVSLLIHRALIDSDDGTLALSELHDYPGAMQRHLEHRDPGVADTIPAAVARRWVVLPIGRSHRGGLVVVARDPTPILAASLQHLTRLPIELAIAPAIHLEKLVRATYGELDAAAGPPAPAPTPIPTRSISDLRLDADEPRHRRPRTVSRVMVDTSPGLTPQRPRTSITRALDGTLQQIENAINRAAAEQHAMTFASRRWAAALLLVVSDGELRGRRGHGSNLGSIDAIRLATDAPSIVQIAYTTRTVSTTVPPGGVQAQLSELLGGATQPAAAPVLAGGQVVAVLAVGDPVSAELTNPLARLAALADAVGAAYERLPR